jgi:hypothetical protein
MSYQTNTIPIGGIIAFAKSLTGAPPLLPNNFVECNGQTLSDAKSPFNGQTIPDLNGNGGTKRFLRGSSTSGTTGGTSISHSHAVTVSATVFSTTVGSTTLVTSVGTSTDSIDATPSYYEVVYIIRIK